MRGRIFVSQTMEAFVSSCTIMAETRCLDSKSRKSCKHLSHVSEAFFFNEETSKLYYGNNFLIDGIIRISGAGKA
jgi:hypothetical protein